MLVVLVEFISEMLLLGFDREKNAVRGRHSLVHSFGRWFTLRRHIYGRPLLLMPLLLRGVMGGDSCPLTLNTSEFLINEAV
jgi:hypothetical protein